MQTFQLDLFISTTWHHCEKIQSTALLLTTLTNHNKSKRVSIAKLPLSLEKNYAKGSNKLEKRRRKISHKKSFWCRQFKQFKKINLLTYSYIPSFFFHFGCRGIGYMVSLTILKTIRELLQDLSSF